MRDRSLEWLNRNSQIAYPFAADSTQRDASDSFSLPDDFFVDIGVYLGGGSPVEFSNYFLHTLSIFDAGVNFTIAYTDGSTITDVAVGSVPRVTHTKNASYRIIGVGDAFADVSGYATIGQFTGLDSQPAGHWVFGVNDSRLEMHAIRPMIRGVSALRTLCDGDLSERFTGDVILKAGKNMRITPVIVSGQDPVFVFDAIDGEGTVEQCDCREDIPNPVTSINGIPIGPDGNFTLSGDTCLTVSPKTHGIELANPCSEPCCGHEEAKTVTQAMELLYKQMATMDAMIATLSARITQVDAVVLGSKVGDHGCDPTAL